MQIKDIKRFHEPIKMYYVVWDDQASYILNKDDWLKELYNIKMEIKCVTKCHHDFNTTLFGFDFNFSV